MNKLTQFLQKTLMPAANKFAQLTLLSIIRNAIMIIIPLTIVGSIGMLLANLPFEAAANFLAPAYPFLNGLYAATSGIMGLAVAMSMGYFTAQRYELNRTFGALTSLVAFLAAQLTEEIAISIDNFGAAGITTAIILGYFSVYLSCLFKRFKIEIRMPDSVPSMVADSFSPIISMLASTAIVLALRLGLGMDINAGLGWLMSPLTNIVGTLPGIVIIAVLCCIFFVCGINPAVLDGISVPVLLMNLELNAAAVAAGGAATHIANYSFYTLAMVGGTGATIGLAILCLLSKSKRYSALGKLAIVPGLCNINEPLIFGVPIMFNPVMAIPFILTSIVNCVSTWVLMQVGLISIPYIMAPWTLPPVIMGFAATGGDWRAAVWSGVLVLISIVIYYPFFKALERQELEKERGEATKA